MSVLSTVSVVVVSYGREAVLVETLVRLQALNPPAHEIVLVDQTPTHERTTDGFLRRASEAGAVSWIRRAEPSIPGAMNQGLLAARGAIVLFLDDDVVPVPDLALQHARAALESGAAIVAGQVLQPGDEPDPLSGGEFGFRSSIAQEVTEMIGANFSVERRFALAIGGFDENFVEVAYRYEAEFCDRVREKGGRIWFEPAASVRHLRAAQGGTRAFGDHLRTWRSSHAVGEYYYWLTAHAHPERWRRIAARPLRAVRTRHHLRRPWWIPATLLGELGGLLRARRLARSGQHLLVSSSESEP